MTEEDRKYFISQGIDPDALIPVSQVGEQQNPTQSFTPSRKPSLPNSSTPGAFFRAAGEAVLPGAAAGLAVRGLAPVGAATGPVGAIAIPALGAGATGAGVGIAQRKLLEHYAPGFIEQRNQDYLNNYWASTLGGVLGGGLAGGFRPDPKELKNLGLGIGQKVFSGKPLDPAVAKNLFNYLVGPAVSAAPMAGIGYAMAKSKGQPFDWKDFAIELGLGLPIGTPTKMGQKFYKYRPNEPMQISAINKAAARAKAQKEGMPYREVPVTEPTEQGFNPLELAKTADAETEAYLAGQANQQKEQTIEYYRRRKALERQISKAANRLEAKKAQDELAELTKDARKYFTGSEEDYQNFVASKGRWDLVGSTKKEQPEPSVITQEDELGFDVAAAREKGPPRTSEQLIEDMQFFQDQLDRTDLTPSERATVEKSLEVLENKFKASERLRELHEDAVTIAQAKEIIKGRSAKKKSKAEGEEEEGARFSEINVAPEISGVDTKLTLADKGLVPVERPLRVAEPSGLGLAEKKTPPPLPTTKPAYIPSAFKSLMQWLAPQRHIRAYEEEGLVRPETGRAVEGIAPSREDVNRALDAGSDVAIKINPSVARAATWPHEYTHVFQQILERSPSKTDQQAVSKLNRAVESDPDYQAWAAQRGDKVATPDEYISSLTGDEIANRVLNKNMDIELMRDWWAHVKTRFGKGNTKDLLRVLSNKLLYDPPRSYGVRPSDTTSTPPKVGRYAEPFDSMYDAVNKAQPEDLISRYSRLSPAEFKKEVEARPEGMTKWAYQMGLNARTPEELSRIRKGYEEAVVRSQELALKDPEAAVTESMRSSFFSEAYGAATGTGSAGDALRKAASYKPRFPREPGIRGERYSETDEGGVVHGADIQRATRLIGSNMYNKDPELTVVKELFQNALSATMRSGNKRINVISEVRGNELKAITVQDHGTGMTPEKIVKVLLPAFTSDKKPGDLGGYGLAKAGIFGNARDFFILTSHDRPDGRYVTEVTGTKEGWLNFIEKGTTIPKGGYELDKLYRLTDAPSISLKVRKSDGSDLGTSFTVKLLKPSNDYSYDNMVYRLTTSPDPSYEIRTTTTDDTSQYVDKGFPLKLQEIGYKVDSVLQNTEVISSKKTPGAEITLYAEKDGDLDTLDSVRVTDHGMFQFYLPFNEDVKLPQLTLEVTPIGNVESIHYPYTINRDGFKGGVDTIISNMLRDVASDYKRKITSKFDEVRNKQKRIGSTGKYFFDISGDVSPDNIAWVTSHIETAKLARAVEPIHNAIAKFLSQHLDLDYKDIEFMGFMSQGGMVGVRFGTPQRGSHGEMYYDLGLIFKDAIYANLQSDPLPLADRLSHELGGTILHEIAHQESFQEGQTHALAMTRIAGYTAEHLYKMTQNLRKLYGDPVKENHLKAYIDEYIDRIKPTDKGQAKSQVESVISFGQSQGIQPRKGSAVPGETGGSSAPRYSEGEGVDLPLVGNRKKFRNIPILEDEASRVSRRMKVDGKVTREGEYAAEKLRVFSQRVSDNLGKYVNTVEDTITRFTPQEGDNVYSSMLRDRWSGNRNDEGLTPSEIELKNALREHIVSIRNDQNKAGLQVKGRAGKYDPVYVPMQLATHVAHEFSKKPASKLSTKYRNEWVKYLEKEGLNNKEATDIVDDYIRALNAENITSVEFAALRRPEGFGLPESLVERNLLNSMSRYGKRVSRDLAFYQDLQSDEIFRAISGIHDQQGNLPGKETTWQDGTPVDTRWWNSDAINDLKWWVRGAHLRGLNQYGNAVLRVGSAAVVQAVTGFRNIGNLVGVIPQYMKGADFASYVTAWPKLMSSWRDAFRANAFRRNPNDIEFGTAVNPDRFLALADEAARVLRTYSGGTFVENASRVYTYAIGDILTTNNFKRLAQNPKDEHALAFVKRHGKTVDNLDSYIGKSLDKIPLEVIRKMAKDFSDLAQGTYDARGLNRDMIDSMVAPVFMLSRWAMERSNILVRDVVNPALNGDLLPLFKYTLGSIAASAIIQLVNDAVGKRRSVPTIKEALAAENKKELAGAILARMQLAAFGGFVGDVFAGLYQGVTLGRAGQGFRFGVPIVEIGEGLYDNTRELVGILARAAEGKESPETAIEASLQFIDEAILQKIQMTRTIADNTWRKEDKERAERYRDLRVFYEMTGARDITADMPKGSRIKDKEKRFKQETDLEEAWSMLPDLVQRAFVESDGNILEFKDKISKLKANSYQTMPNPDQRIDRFINYYNYLVKTQGQEAAQERLQDWLIQTTKNKLKTAPL